MNKFDELIGSFEESVDIFSGLPIRLTYYFKGYSRLIEYTGCFSESRIFRELQGYRIRSDERRGFCQRIAISSANHMQTSEFLRLSYYAGQLISENEKSEWGLQKIHNPRISWLAFLLEYSLVKFPKFVHPEKAKNPFIRFTYYESIEKPFLLSVRLLKILHESRVESKPKTRKESNFQKITAIMKAIAIMENDPTLKDYQIAKMIGYSPATLSRSKRYQAARSIVNNKKKLPKGFFTDSGSLEVFDS